MTHDPTTEIDLATASAAWPRVQITDDLDLQQIPYLEFCGRVLEGGFAHALSLRWPTARESLDAVLVRAVSTSRWRRTETALLDLGSLFGGDCLVYVAVGGGHVGVRIGARDLPVLAEAEAWLRSEFPEREPTPDQAVPITFWSVAGAGGYATSRDIDVPSWASIEHNYPRAVAARLGELASDFRPGEGGKLVLWYGEPGTGKTFALRALAWEWRSWCELHYVTDPDVFFGGRADYLMEVVLHEPDEEQRWRVLVLEDTGELLAADAKERTGQGLSRLLNLVDGIVGQGLRVLVLVTTNEDLRSLHPAVSRPGRCAAKIEFTAFPAEEAAAWLEARGGAAEARAGTLAALYARLAGTDEQAPKPIGFGA